VRSRGAATCSRLLFEYYRLLVLPLGFSADYGYDQIPLAASLLDWRSGAALILPIRMAVTA
jgi:hypothetical protein